MSDTKITGLTSASALTGPEILAASQGGNSRGVTATQIQAFVNNAPIFAAGSATAGSWPIHTPGTLLTSATPGAVEVDANCFYMTTDAGNRGVVDIVHFIRQHADRAAFANNTNQQAIFDSVASGTLTLETGCYMFEALIALSGMSATSGNLKWSLLGAGGATLGAILQQVLGFDGANDTPLAVTGTSLIASNSTANNVLSGTTATVATFQVRGTFECTGAGTIIPSVAQFTATAAAVTTAGSYFRCRRIGAASVVSVGQWS